MEIPVAVTCMELTPLSYSYQAGTRKRRMDLRRQFRMSSAGASHLSYHTQAIFKLFSAVLNDFEFFRDLFLTFGKSSCDL